MTDYLYRINCGVTEDHFPAGWCSDQSYVSGGGTVTREADLPIHAGELSEVIRSERYNAEAFRLPLAPGSYDIRIIFAFTFEGAHVPNKQFDVRVNGKIIRVGFNPFVEAGGYNKPAIIVLSAFQQHGSELLIEFSKQSIVNGIEISRASQATSSVGILAPYKEQGQPFMAPIKKNIPSKRMLFIGNSGTFYWAIPETSADLIKNSTSQLQLEVESITSGGKRLEWHFSQAKCLDLIRNGNYDYVVMQDSSGGPLDFADSMSEYADKLIAVVREAGSIPILYAYQGPEKYSSEQRQLVMDRYAAIAQRHQVALVPAALALDKAMRALPETNFHNPDRHHLGMFGAYVTACCFYTILTGNSAEGHPYPAVLGESIQIPLAIARVLERCASEACAAYKHLSTIA